MNPTSQHFREKLIQETLKLKLGKLHPNGALIVQTGKHTGRSTKERFISDAPETAQSIQWNAVNQKFSHEVSNKVFQKLEEKINDQNFYEYNGYAGWFPIQVKSLSPWHILFAQNMFRESPVGIPLTSQGKLPEIKIYHDPYGNSADLNLDLPTNPFLLLDPLHMRVAIIGTAYAGEIKKSAFTLCNYKLPEMNVLPMHSSANCLEDGKNASVIFGLSGTGKTTLSACEDRYLIGDDEIVWTETGISNLEGGCYAKLINLEESKEPQIFHAVHKSGAIMENVEIDEATQKILFDSSAITENTRGSYPLSLLEKTFTPDKEASHPKTIIFLTADAFGALPAVAKLDEWQAQYHFIMGYTARVAGTEIGVKEPSAVFSACFGGPFMPRPATVYAKMLVEKAKKHNASIWLLNTGWTGGGYGVGSRFPIPTTRLLLKAIQDGTLDQQKTVKHPLFGFEVPVSCPGVDPKWLEVPHSESLPLLAHKFLEHTKSLGNMISPELIQKGAPQL